MPAAARKKKAKGPPPFPANDPYFTDAHWQKNAVPWSENVRYTRGPLILDRDSYNAYILDWMTFWGHTLIPLAGGHIGEIVRHGVQVGPWWLYLRRLPAFTCEAPSIPFCPFPLGPPRWGKAWLPMVRAGRKVGDVTFAGDVAVPILCDDRARPWMSLTPSEIVSQRPGLRKARGHVLIGGLGMGWLARRCLEKKGVKQVTVAEQSADVAQAFGPPLKRAFGDRVRIVTEDAYRFLARNPAAYDAVLFDIWQGGSDASFDRRWTAVQKTHRNAWAWGYSARND